MSLKSLVVLVATLLSTTDALAQQFPKLSDKSAARILIENYGVTLGVAETAAARPVTAVGLALIKDFEGWVPHAYNDAANFCTIGYGHLIALKPCEQINLGRFSRAISEDVGAALLEDDTKVARLAVQALVSADLSDEQFSALASFVFNVGRASFSSSTLLKLLNDRQPVFAAKEFPRWVRAGGRVLPGLVSRRACESDLFQGQLTLAGGRFDRRVCAVLGAAQTSGPLIDIEVGEKR